MGQWHKVENTTSEKEMETVVLQNWDFVSQRAKGEGLRLPLGSVSI